VMRSLFYKSWVQDTIRSDMRASAGDLARLLQKHGKPAFDELA